MFILGASAHILIYLLVPAFLIVCLYFNGKPGSPEISDLLPVFVMHEPQVQTINTKDTYIYGVSQQQPEKKTERKFHTFIPPVFHFCTVSAYQSLEMNNNTLRAPPVLILDC